MRRIIRDVLLTSGITPWYRAGGSPAPIAVYQPIGAATLAASYINLINPGTYDLTAPGTAPTFDSSSGWGFDGTLRYLATGIVPQATWSVIARVNLTIVGTVYPYIWGALQTTPTRGFCIRNLTTTGITYWNGITPKTSLPALGAGVVALAGTDGYRNGSIEVTDLGGISGNTIGMYIGTVNFDGAPLAIPNTGSIQALAIYNTTLSGPQVMAVTTDMNEL